MIVLVPSERPAERLHREKDLSRPQHDCQLCTPTKVVSEQEKSRAQGLFEMKGTHAMGQSYAPENRADVGS